ncbi:MAG: DnaA regulatory inactivator Hda [Sulfuriferula sp.]|nr:DnaA regulatory inactivator Hda [Sulfuriferula sp.]
MQQLILDIIDPPAASFENFVTAANAELIAALHALISQADPTPQLYLWGTTGSGKTHLLQACVKLAQATGMSAAYFNAVDFTDADTENLALIAVDNVEQLDAESQIKLFNLINQVREGQGRLISAGMVAPMQLPLRVDVTTRLGWDLIYQIQPLSDADKLRVLTHHAEDRGLSLQAHVTEYLIHHWRRDLPSLMAALDSLDRYSLQTQRAITVPLLKEILPK